MKISIIFSSLALLLVFGLAGTAQAATASLYLSPSSVSKTVGDFMNITVGIAPAENNVLAVEGSLVFNNLNCESIVVANDIVAQAYPTCENSHFLLGISSGTTVNKNLFTVTVKAGTAGMAGVSFTGVDIIGAGVSLSSAATNGNYTINALSELPPAEVKPAEETTPAKSTTKPTAIQPVEVLPEISSTTDTEPGGEVLGEKVFAEPESVAAPTPIKNNFGIIKIIIALVVIMVLVIGIRTAVRINKK